MSSTFCALGNNCIILHRLAKHCQGFKDFHFNCENVLELHDQTDFITWQITAKLNVNSYQGFIDTVWRWFREHGQKFSLQPTSITNTSLDAGLLRGLVFKSYSPLCISLLSASSNRSLYRAWLTTCHQELILRADSHIYLRTCSVNESLEDIWSVPTVCSVQENSQFSTNRSMCF